jgi:hypothetical protein
LFFVSFLPIAIKGFHKFTILSWLFAVFLIACSKQSNVSDLEKNFATLIPIDDMNHSLVLLLEGADTSFSSGSRINMRIYNKSQHYLYFENETHMRILASPDDLQWKEVENSFTYATSSMTLSPEGTILLDDAFRWAIPILDESFVGNGNSEIPLRIVVIGEIMKDDAHTGQLVGAFVDVSMKP